MARVVLHSLLLLLTLSMQAMNPIPVCSSGRHLRRNSWPKIASDLCTEATFHNVHEECANKGLQVRLRQAGLKAILVTPAVIVIEHNQEIEEEE